MRRTHGEAQSARYRRAINIRELARNTGAVVFPEKYTGGGAKNQRRTRALLIGGGGPQGGISVDPGVAFAYYVRRKMQPIRVAPTVIYNPQGRRIGLITVDPVTGQRTRAMDPTSPPHS